MGREGGFLFLLKFVSGRILSCHSCIGSKAFLFSSHTPLCDMLAQDAPQQRRPFSEQE